MDMHLIYDRFSSQHDPDRSSRAPLKAPLLALLVLLGAMLSLAIAGPARAGAEVVPVSEHLGGPLASPLTAPTVVSIEPSTGPTAGGTAVKIKGTEFVTPATVTIGGAAATEVVVVTPEEITAKTPAGSAGPQEVVVNDANGPSSAGAKFTYAAVPTVTGLSPAFGPPGGATHVTITGTALTGATAVKFGTAAATGVKVNSETSVEAVSPAGSGRKHVTVTTPGGTSTATAADEFTYAPTVTSIEPSSGPAAGGTLVKIKGTGFLAGSAVTIGVAATEVKVVSELEITAETSATSAGQQEVVVSDGGGSSTGGPKYTFVPAPAVTGVSPKGGAAAGGTKVTITGANLTGATQVKFGANPATGLKVNSETSAEAVSPAGTGKVHVTVTTAGGTSAEMPADEFTYAPTVVSIEPSSGSTTGGTTLKIIGTGFLGGSTVTIGGKAATEVTVKSESEITAKTPANVAGPKKVVVSDEVGESTGGPEYIYLAAPTVTSITPTTGPPTGGTSVTIHGSGYLAGVQNVKFGSTVAPGTPVVNPEGTSVTVTSPAGTGTVNVTVTTLTGGTSAISSADEFTYAVPVVPGGGTSNTGKEATCACYGPPPPPPPPPPTTGLPVPVLAQSANVVTVAGLASVRLPGARSFVSLSSARQIPYGTMIEATHGEVSVTAAKPGGGTQRGQFFDGEFVLSQATSGRVLATLAGGNFNVCRPVAGTARAKSKIRGKFAAATHLVRRLWAEAHGNFSTRARYAGSSVTGAQWLTEDMCEGSLILATREQVEVTDLVRHRNKVLPTGGIYLAKQP